MATNPLLILHSPNNVTKDGLDDRINNEIVNVIMPIDIFSIRLESSNTTGIRYWKPTKQKTFIWGGYQYSIETIHLTNQITSAFNRNDDLPLSLQGSQFRHSNSSIEPIIPQATLLLKCQQLRLMKSSQPINPKVSAKNLIIHIPVVSSNHSNLNQSGLPILEYSPGTNNDLFQQMNPSSGTSSEFELDLTFLQYRNRTYPRFFVIQSRIPEDTVNVYLNGLLKIQGTQPQITSSQFQEMFSRKGLMRPDGQDGTTKKEPAGNVILRGTPSQHIEPIYYATLKNFEVRPNLSQGIPGKIVTEDGTVIQGNVLKSIESSLNPKESPPENIGKEIYLMFLYLTLIIFGLFVFYNGLPYIWSFKNYSPIITYIVFGIILVLGFTGLILGYNLYKISKGNDNYMYQNLLMGLYIGFIGTHYSSQFSNGFSNVVPPNQFFIKEEFEKEMTLIFEEFIQKLNNQENPVLPLLTKTEFRNTFFVPYLKDRPTIFRNFSGEQWDILKKHLVYETPEEGSSILKSLQAYVLKDLPTESPENIQNYLLYLNTTNLEKFSFEGQEGELEVETNIGLIILNVLILLVEVYLLIQTILQIVTSVNRLTPNIREEDRPNEIWNIIINSVFALIVMVLFGVHIYRWTSIK
jgi:hypothetical protein